jgi:tetraacyldisaccharide 4'-kinase
LRSPVLSIGSLSAGGAGKTPLTLALARALTQGSTHSSMSGMQSGTNIAVLSRGYGRSSAAPARVDPQGSADDFGDEPLLLAQAGFPVYVAAERYQAGLLAERDADSGSLPLQEPRQGVSRHDFSRADAVGEKNKRALAHGTIHLLDDGFQHRQLHRDVDILLFSGHDRDDRLLPAGNLREPLSALRRATILAIPAEEAETQSALTLELGWQGPVWSLRRRMEIPAIDGPAIAFCGIARPGQFFSGLEAAGVTLAARIAFPDHHRYTPADLARLRSMAQGTGARALLTTEKDRVRLGSLAAELAQMLPLLTAALRIEIEEQEAAIAGLLDALGPRRP